jgi:glycine betaine catabolism A
MQEEALRSRAAAWKPQPTLPGRDYFDAAVYEADRRKVFHSTWTAIAREEEIPQPGDFITRELAGESILLTRALDGGLRAFYNVCRHRGTRLVKGAGNVRKVITCPYHAWSYDLAGNCVGAPNVHKEEGFDRSSYPLWNVGLCTWAGFVFVNLDEDASTLEKQLADDPDDPTSVDHYRMQDLRIGREITYDVPANWKIVIDNYNECLHCPVVHPEFVQIVPISRRGEVQERDDWGGNSLDVGVSSMTITGASGLPPLPGITPTDAHTYYGFHVFPNLLLNLTPDHVMYYLLLPQDAERTTVISNYLFRPETIANLTGFAEKAEAVVEFWDLVSRQDWGVCEQAQAGVRSRAFAAGGVYPFQDRLLHDFNQHYRRIRGPVDQPTYS